MLDITNYGWRSKPTQGERVVKPWTRLKRWRSGSKTGRTVVTVEWDPRALRNKRSVVLRAICPSGSRIHTPALEIQRLQCTSH